MKINFMISSMCFSVKVSRQLTFPPVTVDSSILRVFIQQKYLGLIFDSQLSCSSHLSGVAM